MVFFSIVSAVSHLGLVLLAAAFIRDSVPRRYSSVDHPPLLSAADGSWS